MCVSDESLDGSRHENGIWLEQAKFLTIFLFKTSKKT